MGEDCQSYGLQNSLTLPANLSTKTHCVVAPVPLQRVQQQHSQQRCRSFNNKRRMQHVFDSRDSSNWRMAINHDVSQRWGSFAVNISLHAKSSHLSIFIECRNINASHNLQLLFNYISKCLPRVLQISVVLSFSSRSSPNLS